ncbi:MAG: hypothetical protein AAGD14_03725 [Planctomycetota bacterium]
MGRLVVVVALALGGSLLTGCTSFLAMQGDPDLTVLRRGAQRAEIEREMGKADDVRGLEEGRYIALYVIKLGAPKNTAARGESLTNLGAGFGATIASGAFARATSSLAAGEWASAGSAGTAAAAIGLTVWAAGELVGTVRELNRLAQRRKHQLEVVYDRRNRMLTHEIIPLERTASVTLAERISEKPPSRSELQRTWRGTYKYTQ